MDVFQVVETGYAVIHSVEAEYHAWHATLVCFPEVSCALSAETRTASLTSPCQYIECSAAAGYASQFAESTLSKLHVDAAYVCLCPGCLKFN